MNRGHNELRGSEHATRQCLIDKALIGAGWRVVSLTRWPAGGRSAADAVGEYSTASGPTDCLLLLYGKAVANVETKKLEATPQIVVEHAGRYAHELADSGYHFGEFGVSLVYSFNGDLSYTNDLRDPLARTRQIDRFHTLSVLREFLPRNLNAADLWLRTHFHIHDVMT